MFRKLTLIFFLATGLAVFLFFQPWKLFEIQAPRFYDRLPSADIIGKTKILELSKSFSATLHHYKIPLRDFFSQDFILGQGKSFGLDLQSPVYYFINQEDWTMTDLGALIMVTDSSRIQLGVEKLRKLINLKDTSVLDQRVYYAPEENTYMTYGKDWMLIYSGKDFNNMLRNVKYAKYNQMPPKWKALLKEGKNESNLYAFIAFEELRNEGIRSIDLQLSNDTTNVLLHTKVNYIDTLLVSLKSSGPAFEDRTFTRNNISLHLNVEKLKKNPDNALAKLITHFGKKFGFPVGSFMQAWQGDLAFRQGGLETITEEYIVSELDEDFNITEVKKNRELKIQGFSIFISLNDKGPEFLNRLFAKGILTKEEEKFRFLYSPPLRMNFNKESLSLHTAKYPPKMYDEPTQFIKWTYQQTPYEFYLDSSDYFTLYGRIRIPLDNLVKTSIPSEN